jgi:hypothetical protein
MQNMFDVGRFNAVTSNLQACVPTPRKDKSPIGITPQNIPTPKYSHLRRRIEREPLGGERWISPIACREIRTANDHLTGFTFRDVGSLLVDKSKVDTVYRRSNG